MIKSEELNLLAPALARAQNQIGGVALDDYNPHFEKGYASLQRVILTVLPILQVNELSITQGLGGEKGDDNFVNITTLLMHSSGQYVGSDFRIPARPVMKRGETEPGPVNAQSVGSAITYGRRYAILSLLGIAADKDDDGNRASEPPTLRSTPTTKLPAPPPEPDFKQTEDNEFGGEEPATLEQVGKLRIYSEVQICKPITSKALRDGGYGSFEQFTTEEAANCIQECQDAMNKEEGDEPEEAVKTRKTCPKDLKYLEKWLTGHETTVNSFCLRKNLIQKGQTWRDLDESNIQRLAENPDGFAAAADLPEPPNNPY